MIIAAIVVVLAVVSYIYYYQHSVIRQIEIPEVNPVNVVFQIDDLEISGDTLRIGGWCFRDDLDTSDSSQVPHLRAVLAEAGNEGAALYTSGREGIARADVGQYYNDDNDYTNSGFEVLVDLKKTDPDKRYEILLQRNERSTDAVHTGLFLQNRAIGYGDGTSYLPPETAGTDLQDIVDQGRLTIYHPEYGIWGYLYDGSLYVITDDTYPFRKYGDNMELNVYSTRLELLGPEWQVHGFEPHRFFFEEKEITDSISCGPYRVAKVDLPADFPVTTVLAGALDEENEWLWMDVFCPGLTGGADAAH